jgi:hypothetical protein
MRGAFEVVLRIAEVGPRISRLRLGEATSSITPVASRGELASPATCGVGGEEFAFEITEVAAPVRGRRVFRRRWRREWNCSTRVFAR